MKCASRITISFLICLISFSLSAQICGDVYLATQTDVDNFDCTEILGSLFIQDDNDGIDNITSLNSIFSSGLTTVAGNVEVSSCNNLLSFNGLDGIQTISGDLEIANNPLAEFAFDWQVVNIGSFLYIANNNSITDIEVFTALTSVSHLRITENETLTQISGFDLLNSASTIVIDNNNALTTISGFDGNLISLDIFSLSSNISLTSIPVFNSLTNVGDYFNISNNALIEISGFNSLSSVFNNFEILDEENLLTLNGFGVLASVGSFILKYNHAVIDYSGFNSLTTVTNSFTIENNDTLETISGMSSLITIGGDLKCNHNDALLDLSGFNDLNSIGGLLQIISNDVLFTVSGFDSLTSVDSFSFEENNAIVTISGFNALTSISNLFVIGGNVILTTISGFSALSYVGGDYNLTSNFSLVDVSGFTSFLGPIEDVFLSGNLQLSCCKFVENWTAANFILISNASGCNDISEIGFTAPVIPCIPDYITFADPSSCTASVTFMDPDAFDNCLLNNYNFTMIDGNDVMIYDEVEAIQGLSEDYNLPIGINEFRYTAVDEDNLETTCSTYITVQDIQVPQWTGSNGITITGECGIDDLDDLFIEGFDELMLNAQDNCPNDVIFTLFSENEQFICGSFSTEYTVAYIISDIYNNTSGVTGVITIQLFDTEPPLFNDMPNNAVINCSEDWPLPPVVSATDICAGDLSSEVIISDPAITYGTCENNETTETRIYTYSVFDGCLSTEHEWSVTRMSDFDFDLGDDIIECTFVNITLEAPVSNQGYLWSTGETTSSIIVSTSGVYSVTISTTNGCCYTDNISVFFNPEVGAVCDDNDLATINTTFQDDCTCGGGEPNPDYCENYDLLVADPCDGIGILDENCNCIAEVGLDVALNVLLEGPYYGLGLMNASLVDLEILQYANGNLVFNSNAVDWVTVILINEDCDEVASTDALLMKNGNVLANFDSAIPGDYYLRVEHRNHLNITSAQTVSIPNLDSPFNFSNSMDAAAGVAQQIEVEEGFFAMFAGDADGNNINNVVDFNLWAANPAATYVYESYDFDCNGIVNVADYNLWRKNASKVGGASPCNDMPGAYIFLSDAYFE